MHGMCTFMSSKTISLSEAAYRRLQAQRRGAGDSFSQIVLRAQWEDEAITAAELLDLCSREGSVFSEEELEAMESAKREQPEPVDKWNAR